MLQLGVLAHTEQAEQAVPLHLVHQDRTSECSLRPESPRLHCRPIPMHTLILPVLRMPIQPTAVLALLVAADHCMVAVAAVAAVAPVALVCTARLLLHRLHQRCTVGLPQRAATATATAARVRLQQLPAAALEALSPMAASLPLHSGGAALAALAL